MLILESNLAFESQHLLHALENAGVKNWVSLSEGQQGSLGWLTTHERKARAGPRTRAFFPQDPNGFRTLAQEQMCLLLREAMNVGRIGLSPFFFSTELQPREAKQRIKDELSSFCVVNEAPKTTFGKFRKVRQPVAPLTALLLTPVPCAQTYTGKLYGTSVAPESHPLASKCTRAKKSHPTTPSPITAHRQAGRPVHCASVGNDWVPEGAFINTPFTHRHRS